MPDYIPPQDLTGFDDAFFTTMPRETIEYILSCIAAIEYDFVNDNVFMYKDGFNQVMLRDPDFPGMYSLWYTIPVAFGVADYGFQGSIQYSSFFHEMGHNFTLNTPGGYYYGGKIDGNANAIFSESMAQIFQHAAAYELVNNHDEYGLGDDLSVEIGLSAKSSINIVRTAYERYIASGMPFASWNDPGTPMDETFDTFMTIAYVFFSHAETDGLEYRIPAKNMMDFLQIFDTEMEIKYDRLNNSPEADAFRATLLVTALSYGFSLDLRSEFQALNFPVSDDEFDYLVDKYGAPPPPTPTPECINSGDTDQNGALTPGDALIAFNIYLGTHPDPTWEEVCAADCYGDGGVTPNDALCIFSHYVSGSCNCVDDIPEFGLNFNYNRGSTLNDLKRQTPRE